MRLLASSVFVFAAALSMAQSTSAAPKFDIATTEKDALPRSKVYFVVGEKRVLLRTVTGQANNATEAPTWAPKGAVATASLWWAGQGDDFYVVQKGNRYRIYHRGVSEESKPGRFKLIKTVKA